MSSLSNPLMSALLHMYCSQQRCLCYLLNLIKALSNMMVIGVVRKCHSRCFYTTNTPAFAILALWLWFLLAVQMWCQRWITVDDAAHEMTRLLIIQSAHEVIWFVNCKNEGGPVSDNGLTYTERYIPICYFIKIISHLNGTGDKLECGVSPSSFGLGCHIFKAFCRQSARNIYTDNTYTVLNSGKWVKI